MNTTGKNSRIRKFVAATLVTITLAGAVVITPADSGAMSQSVNRLSRGDSASAEVFRMAADTPQRNGSAYLHPWIGFTAE